jgi:uncharacterized protein
VTQRFHEIPAKEFAALAAGGGGAAAVRGLVAAQRSKHLILLRGVLDAALQGRDDKARSARAGYELLAAAYRRDPGAAGAVIKHPSVGAWALHMLQGANGSDSTPSGLRSLAAAAAIRARMPATIEISASDGNVMLPSLGAASINGAENAVVRSTEDHFEIVSSDAEVITVGDPREEAPGWLPLRLVKAGPHTVILDDLDPFRMPLTSNLRTRLSKAETGAWEAALCKAWPLLEPRVAEEFTQVVTTIVPCTSQPEGHVSMSSRENFGAIAMSPSPETSTLGATLTHELHHLKLFAVMEIIQLYLPDDGRRYYAPWREDPRPAGGLLQGAYAFLGVTGFWRWRRQFTSGTAATRCLSEFARWRSATAEVIRTLLASGQLTTAGIEFVQGMDRTLAVWGRESVPTDAQEAADRQAKAHRTRWQMRNGPA